MSISSTCSSSCDCGGPLAGPAGMMKPVTGALLAVPGTGGSSPFAVSPFDSPRSHSSDTIFHSDDLEATDAHGATANVDCGAAGNGGGSVLPSNAEFIMFEWKTKDCPLGHDEHDWSTCVFAHPGEKSRRRSPRDRAYSALCCPDVRRRGRCPRGGVCPFAHSVFEIWMHPARFRTKMCRDGTSCSRPVCFFAHKHEELRTPAPEDLAALEQRRAAQQLQQQQRAQLDQERNVLSPLPKPAAVPMGAKPACGKRGAPHIPAPAWRDEMTNARLRVWQHLMSLRAQQEHADALRLAAQSSALIQQGSTGSSTTYGLNRALLGATVSSHDTPLFGTSPPASAFPVSNVGSPLGMLSGGGSLLGGALPPSLDGFGLGEGLVTPSLQPLGHPGGQFDALLSALTAPPLLPSLNEEEVSPMTLLGWQGPMGSPPPACQPRLTSTPFPQAFELW